MGQLTPKETIYHDIKFRSRIEARWACFFDTLDIEWIYELQHYDFGVKRIWEEYEFQDYLQEALSENYYDEEDEVIRNAYRHRYERDMYLPDFWLPEFEHWVEIKGKIPNWQEKRKAEQLARQSGRPVTILWNHIFPGSPDENWGECSEVYGNSWNIIAILTINFSIKSIEHAFTMARTIRFK